MNGTRLKVEPMTDQKLRAPENLLPLVTKLAGEMGENDRLFVDRIFSEGIQKYEDRLKAIGFINAARVLDAGCGFGQWSLALAGLNQNVCSCDVSNSRIDFLESMTQKTGAKNIGTRVAGIDVLPYEDNCFDLVFCYGVLFVTPWRTSLAELSRVLKPGGRLYVSANEIGWYLHLWLSEHNKAEDYDPRQVAANAFSETLEYDRSGKFLPGSSLIIERGSLVNELNSLGFVDIDSGPEGTLHLNTDVSPPHPFFKAKYAGLDGPYEVVAQKNGLWK